MFCQRSPRQLLFKFFLQRFSPIFLLSFLLIFVLGGMAGGLAAARAAQNAESSARASAGGKAKAGGADRSTLGTSVRVGFRAGVSYASGGVYADAVAVADVNGDGKPDLVVANHCADKACAKSSIGVLLGNGDGTFQAAVSYDVGAVTHDSPAVAITTGDVNGDGYPDVVVVSGARVGILLGNGDGTFQPVASFGTGGRIARAVAAVDVNGDGRLDLVIASACPEKECAAGTFSVLLGNGDGTFQKGMRYALQGNDAFGLSVADVNHDGKPDVVVASANEIEVWMGKGDGTFRAAKSYGAGAHAIAAGDVNGDGKVDLAWGGCANASCEERAAGVLLGKGDATFASANLASESALKETAGVTASDSVAMVDINGDGKLDVLVGNHCGVSAGCAQKEISVLLGNGDGTFRAAKSFGESAYMTAGVAAADLNGDGKPDVVVAKHCASESSCAGGVEVMINASEETALASTTTTVTSTPNPSVYWGEITFTATVAAASGTPTGTVDFQIGSQDQQIPLIGGVAIATFSAVPVGSNTMTASYSGDSEFAGSSGTVVQTVTKESTSLALSSSANPAQGGQTVTYSAIITTQGAFTGTITFTDNGNTLGAIPVGSSSAQVSESNYSAGTHAIVATYSGDSNNVGSTGNLTEVVQPVGVFRPTSQTFPAQPLHTTSTFKPIGFFNFTQATVMVSNVTTTGDFAVSANSCMNGVKPNTHCDVDIVFTPTATGTRTGTVTFTDTAPNSPQTATLTGTGIGGSLVKLSVTPARSVYGTTPITFAATVTGSSGTTPTGQVSFMNGSMTLGTATLTGGTATLVIPLLDAATYEVAAAYGGDSNNPPGTSDPVKVVVEKNTSTTVLTSVTPNPVGANQPFTMMVSVTGGGQPASGNVAFLGHRLGGPLVVYGTAGLSPDGTAALSHSLPNSGPYDVIAKFLGGQDQKYSWSRYVSLTVQNVTTTSWTSSLNPAPFGQTVTFTVQVANRAAKLTGAGTVTLMDGKTTLGSVSTTSSIVTFPITGLAKGTHSIQAIYGGDTYDQGSASPVMNQLVQAIVSTTTQLTAFPNPSVFGQPVSLTAAVRSGTFPVQGSVRFMRGSSSLGTATLDASGNAVLSVTTLPVGTDALTAVYAGSTGFRGSRSSAVSEVVNAAATKTTVSSSENPAPKGTPVTFTATVAPAFTGTPTGTVTFMMGSTVLGTVTLVNGMASVTPAPLGLGTHTITATYNGSADFTGSSGKVAQRTE